MPSVRCFSGNMLKIFAAVCMVIDHVGLMFFPQHRIFRVLGRLAFPIFAFMISEGARYTRSRRKYFLTMFSIAAICQVVYYVFDNSLYMCILVTFSLSLVMLFALSEFKKKLFAENSSLLEKLGSGVLFVASVAFCFLLNQLFTIDYGFEGCLLPVFASLTDFRGINVSEGLAKLDNLTFRIAVFGVGLLLTSLSLGGLHIYSLMALIPLLFYSGKRGKYKMKYFFYFFYPLHLVALEGLYMLTYYLR